MTNPLFQITEANTPNPRTITRGQGQPGKGEAIRIYNADRELTHTGRQWTDGSEEQEFAALDWARNDVGATYLKYRGKDGRWHHL